MERWEIVVEGRVQGVWFRRSTKDRADELELAGTVRNLESGTGVEVIVEGREGQCSDLLRFVHRGPPGAEVRTVRARRSTPQGLRGFEILR